MKTKMKLLVLGSLVATSAILVAQDGPPPGRGGGQGGPGGQRPVPPLMTALDPNQDGVIDAGEINAAAAALKKLDKNGDGQLSHDEFMGERPQGPGRRGGQGQRPQRSTTE